MKQPKKQAKPTPEDWQKELKTLLDGSNPERSKELQEKLDYFNYGIR